MLNGTQKNELDGFLFFIIETIISSTSDIAFQIRALKICFWAEEELSVEDKHWLLSLDISEEIEQIHKIYNHPCPQNRRVGSPYLGLGEDGVDENGIVFYEPNGHDRGICREPKGLLSSTARNDDTCEPVTKADVVGFIKRKFNLLIEERENLLQILELPKQMFRFLNLFSFKPLHIACMTGNIEAVEKLFEFGAKINETNILGETPLHWAAWTGKRDIVKCLLEHGADKNARSYKGKTPLDGAIEFGYFSVAKTLATEIDVERINRNKLKHYLDNGKSFKTISLIDRLWPLSENLLKQIFDHALVSSDFEVCSHLLNKATDCREHLKNLLAGDSHGYNIILQNSHNPRMLDLILSSGIDLNTRKFSRRSYTLATELIQNASVDTHSILQLIKILIKYKANLNISNTFDCDGSGNLLPVKLSPPYRMNPLYIFLSMRLRFHTETFKKRNDFINPLSQIIGQYMMKNQLMCMFETYVCGGMNFNISLLGLNELEIDILKENDANLKKIIAGDDFLKHNKIAQDQLIDLKNEFQNILKNKMGLSDSPSMARNSSMFRVIGNGSLINSDLVRPPCQDSYRLC